MVVEPRMVGSHHQILRLQGVVLKVGLREIGREGHPPQVHQVFPFPAAPDRAAKAAGRTLDPEAVRAWIASHRAEVTLVEGVGGWRVPLAPGWSVDDLAAELGHPVLVVAANRLGVLNHTLLTVEAVRGRGLAVAGVVLNDRFAGAGPLPDWNAEDLRERLPAEVPLARFPAIRLPDGLAAAGATLLEALRLGQGAPA